MTRGLEKTLTKKIADLDDQIAQLQGHLGECNKRFQRSVNTIVGVNEKRSEKEGEEPELKYVMANDGETGANRNLLAGGALPVMSPDPWTKVVFTSSSDNTNSTMLEKSMSAEAKGKIGGLWWGAEASVSTSSASKYVFTFSRPSLYFDLVLTVI